MSRKDDLSRIEPMISALRRAWIANPELRLGQLVDSARFFDSEGTPIRSSEDVFYATDDDIRNGLYGISKRLERKAGEKA